MGIGLRDAYLLYAKMLKFLMAVLRAPVILIHGWSKLANRGVEEYTQANIKLVVTIHDARRKTKKTKTVIIERD